MPPSGESKSLEGLSEVEIRELLTIKSAVENVRKSSGYGSVEILIKCALITEISISYSLIARELDVRKTAPK